MIKFYNTTLLRMNNYFILNFFKDELNWGYKNWRNYHVNENCQTKNRLPSPDRNGTLFCGGRSKAKYSAKKDIVQSGIKLTENIYL